MKRETILEIIESIGNGKIFRVGYVTELPVKAEFKKKGYRMLKVTETSCRTGVNYGNIATVKARKENEETYTPRTNNYEWVIHNKVRHNTRTEKDYLYVATLPKGHNTHSTYILEGTMVGTIDMGDEIEDAYKHLLIDSYFKRNGLGSEVKNISFENILHINNLK